MTNKIFESVIGDASLVALLKERAIIKNHYAQTLNKDFQYQDYRWVVILEMAIARILGFNVASNEKIGETLRRMQKLQLDQWNQLIKTKPTAIGELPSIYELKDPVNIKGLKKFLIWLSAPVPYEDPSEHEISPPFKNTLKEDISLPAISEETSQLTIDSSSKQYENQNPAPLNKFWADFKIFAGDYIPYSFGLDIGYETPVGNFISHDIFEDAGANEIIEHLNSFNFWHIYLKVSQSLGAKNFEGIENKTKDAMHFYQQRFRNVLLEVIGAISEEKEQEIQKRFLQSNPEDEAIKDGALRRKEVFRKYLEQSLDEEYEELLIKYKENDSFNSKQLLTYAGLRWSYDDTVRRGVYHTQDCWIERNILSRCLYVMQGLDPYMGERFYSGSSKELDLASKFQGISVPSKCLFELKAVISSMEDKRVRWSAKGEYMPSLQLVIKQLNNIIKILEIYAALSKIYEKMLNATYGNASASANINLIDKMYRKEELISVSEVALVTGMKVKTIMNESKSLEGGVHLADFAKTITEDSDFCWRTYGPHGNYNGGGPQKIYMLHKVHKDSIYLPDQVNFNSRCFSMFSVVAWIIYKKYYSLQSSQNKIPLAWISHDKPCDLGIKELI
jgi:hypothetical protein